MTSERTKPAPLEYEARERVGDRSTAKLAFGTFQVCVLALAASAFAMPMTWLIRLTSSYGRYPLGIMIWILVLAVVAMLFLLLALRRARSMPGGGWRLAALLIPPGAVLLAVSLTWLALV